MIYKQLFSWLVNICFRDLLKFCGGKTAIGILGDYELWFSILCNPICRAWNLRDIGNGGVWFYGIAAKMYMMVKTRQTFTKLCFEAVGFQLIRLILLCQQLINSMMDHLKANSNTFEGSPRQGKTNLLEA